MEKRLRLILALSFASLSLGLGTARADIYKWTDAQGRVHFGDKDSNRGGQKAEVVKVRVNSYEHVTYTTVFKNRPAVAGDHSVTLYGTDWCGYCRKARAYFQAQGIPFVDLDIEKNAQAKRDYDAMKANGVPVVVVGDKRMNGFSEEGFQRIYR